MMKDLSLTMRTNCAYCTHVMANRPNARNGRKNKRTAKNLSLAPNVIALGEQLATEDKREFSAEVEWLIEQEHKRRELAPTG